MPFTQTQLDAIKQAAVLAVQAECATGCLGELSLAQWCVESAYGTRVVGNNCFGIKPDGHGSGTQYFISREFLNGQWETMKEAFESYATPLDCFLDHGRLITDPHSVYNSCWHQFGLDHDVENLITCVARKYATDPSYPGLLLAISRYPELVSSLSAARSIPLLPVSPPTT